MDYHGGYIGMTTKQFSDYVRKSGSHLIERDHGGPQQGAGTHQVSLDFDARLFDMVHVDPWKVAKDIESGALTTCRIINSLAKRSTVRFEVGTEESIFRMTSSDLATLMGILSERLTPEVFARIEYLVVQSGVGLDLPNARNVGRWREDIFDQLEVTRYYGVKSKEHNGDFLTGLEIRRRSECGIDAINIAPALGMVESRVVLDAVDVVQRSRLEDACLNSIDRWSKWFDGYPGGDWLPVALHYVLADPEPVALVESIEGLGDEIDRALDEQLRTLCSF